MLSEKNEPDTAWHRRFGRRLASGEVGEDRTRGAYLNNRTVWVLAVSLVAAVLLLGGVFIFQGHGLG
jgi:hypothetical protein